MELNNRKLIMHKHNENPLMSAAQIAKSLKLPRRTVSAVIKRCTNTLTVERANGSGAKIGTRDGKLKAKVIRSVKNNPGLSDRDLATKFGSNHTTVRRIRMREGLKSWRAIKHPNRSDKQNLVAKTRARLLYEKVLTKFKGCMIMDDETYVKVDLKQLPGRKFYVSTIRGGVAGKFKYIKMDKFSKKLMIWQAICSCGLKSKVFVTSSTMNTDLYISECLEKRLLPLIRFHNKPTKFWPDLASCHYSQKAIKWYGQNGVDVIPKNMNPPNCPELRPIEKYWANVKGKLRKNGGFVKDINSMRSKWNQFAGKVSRADVRTLMGPIKRDVRAFIRNK